MNNYIINFKQTLMGAYELVVYKNSKPLATIDLGTIHEEAKQKVKDIAEAFENAEVKDHTGQ